MIAIPVTVNFSPELVGTLTIKMTERNKGLIDSFMRGDLVLAPALDVDRNGDLELLEVSLIPESMAISSEKRKERIKQAEAKNVSQQ